MTPARRRAVSARTMDAVRARNAVVRWMWFLRSCGAVDGVNAWMSEDRARVAGKRVSYRVKQKRHGVKRRGAKTGFLHGEMTRSRSRLTVTPLHVRPTPSDPSTLSDQRGGFITPASINHLLVPFVCRWSSPPLLPSLHRRSTSLARPDSLPVYVAVPIRPARCAPSSMTRITTPAGLLRARPVTHRVESSS